MEQKKKVIGTTTYLVTQMDAVSALKIQTKLMKILGPGIFDLVGKKGMGIKQIAAAILPKLIENIDDELVNTLILSLFEKGVFIENAGIPKVVSFSEHFAGKAMEMWKVAGFILEANFAMGESIESSLPTTDQEASKTQES